MIWLSFIGLSLVKNASPSFFNRIMAFLVFIGKQISFAFKKKFLHGLSFMIKSILVLFNPMYQS